MHPTAATFLSQVQEFTVARANYHKKCPTEAKGSKQEVQTKHGHGQTRTKEIKATTCIQELSVIYDTIVARARFKVLALEVCHHVR